MPELSRLLPTASATAFGAATVPAAKEEANAETVDGAETNAHPAC